MDEDQDGSGDAEELNDEQVDAGRQQAATAPYMSYMGFKRLCSESLRANGIPGRFDKSYFGNISGSSIAQTRGTLRHFELIDDQQHPTALLTQLVNADEAGQREVLRRLLEDKYADALALSGNATVGQLAEVFRQRGLSGNTVQKAIAFYVSMAEDVGVEVSPLFKKGRMTASTGSTLRKKRSRSAAGNDQGEAPQPPAAMPTPEEQKAAYVSMLMELAKSNEAGVQDGLLDRIEKALGIGAPGAGEQT